MSKVEVSCFMIMNFKRGLGFKSKDEMGIDIFKKMVAKSDVVVENFRKGTLEASRYYEELKKINPKIILCEISGYGRTGLYANKGGFDLVAQASGLMSITGEKAKKTTNESCAPLTDITAESLVQLVF